MMYSKYYLYFIWQVTPESVAYLAALVSVSEEVRSRCHLKYSVARNLSKSASSDTFAVGLHLNLPPSSVAGNPQQPHQQTQLSGGASSPSNHVPSPGSPFPTMGSFSSIVSHSNLHNRVWLMPLLSVFFYLLHLSIFPLLSSFFFSWAWSPPFFIKYFGILYDCNNKLAPMSYKF